MTALALAGLDERTILITLLAPHQAGDREAIRHIRQTLDLLSKRTPESEHDIAKRGACDRLPLIDISWPRCATKKVAPPQQADRVGWPPAHNDFGSNRSKIIDVIDLRK